MTVAYDGAPFHGFAENEGVPTVAGALRAAIERVLGQKVELVAAGRTDRGVHALGQVLSFDVDEGTDLVVLQRAVNALCRPSIVVRAISVAPPDFHARFSARSRTYRYTIQNAPTPNPLTLPTSWHVLHPIDLAAVRNGSVPFLGVHDFTAFCKRPDSTRLDGSPHSMVREVLSLEWNRAGDEVVAEITATAFCRQMVRTIVGTLVEVGTGRRRAQDIVALLAGGERSPAVAPPQGLVLWSIDYG